MFTEPVAETNGIRVSPASFWPTVLRSPTSRVKIAGSAPVSRQTRSAIFVTATAVSGVFSDGFQTVASPQTAARAAFHDQTATGKLNAVITATTPSGCHCSIKRRDLVDLGAASPPFATEDSGILVGEAESL